MNYLFFLNASIISGNPEIYMTNPLFNDRVSFSNLQIILRLFEKHAQS